MPPVQKISFDFIVISNDNLIRFDISYSERTLLYNVCKSVKIELIDDFISPVFPLNFELITFFVFMALMVKKPMAVVA